MEFVIFMRMFHSSQIFNRMGKFALSEFNRWLSGAEAPD